MAYTFVWYICHKLQGFIKGIRTQSCVVEVREMMSVCYYIFRLP